MAAASQGRASPTGTFWRWVGKGPREPMLSSLADVGLELGSRNCDEAKCDGRTPEVRAVKEPCSRRISVFISWPPTARGTEALLTQLFEVQLDFRGTASLYVRGVDTCGCW